MLKQRIITALIMLGVLLYATLHPSPLPFIGVTLVLVACGAWEWARLNQYGAVPSVLSGLACALLCAGIWLAGGATMHFHVLWTVTGSAWVLLGAWLLRFGTPAWRAIPRPLRWLGGPWVMAVAWLAAMQARLIGINFLFSVLVLVWAADVFAYFTGRALGGRFFRNKLAPSISPGKTWEGALGGLLGVLLCAWGWMQMEAHYSVDSASLYSRLYAMGGPMLLLSVVFLCAMSVVGDLLESLFKRAAGVKDSSQLLPGHGGVLDRLDALLPTLPLTMMLLELGTP